MKSLFDIRIQKLFVVILALKVLASGLGWYFQYQWSLGFAIPLSLMVVYILLGIFRRDKDLSDEKFADTCYYLGFIFTITSIIFSLFDLPYIGTRIQDIAVRFGAAMVSTVLGLCVRVYLVSFKQDVVDAMKDAEDAVIDASRKFTEQLTIALERLIDFESQVNTAAKLSVEQVNIQIESLAKNHSDKLTSFFSDLTERNQEVFTAALSEVKMASKRLAESVDAYSLGMRANLTSIEARVEAFADAVTERLKTTTFPDDYFARHLESPLTQLKSAAEGISSEVQIASVEVGKSSAILTEALKKLRDKANKAEVSMDAVLKLTGQQQAVLTSAEKQLITLEQLSSSMLRFDTLFDKTLEGISANSAVTAVLSTKVEATLVDSTDARKSLEKSLGEIAGKLAANSTSTDSLAVQFGASTSATKQVILKLAENATMTETVAGKLAANSAASALVAGKLDGIAMAEVETTKALNSLGINASTAISKVDDAVNQMKAMVTQLVSLESALLVQSNRAREVAEHSENAKVVGSNTTGLTQTLHATNESSSLNLPIEVRVESPIRTFTGGLQATVQTTEHSLRDIVPKKDSTNADMLEVDSSKFGRPIVPMAAEEGILVNEPLQKSDEAKPQATATPLL